MSYDKTDKWAGCHASDANPRHKGSVNKGMDFAVSPMNGCNPAPLAEGRKVSSVKNMGKG